MTRKYLLKRLNFCCAARSALRCTLLLAAERFCFSAKMQTQLPSAKMKSARTVLTLRYFFFNGSFDFSCA